MTTRRLWLPICGLMVMVCVSLFVRQAAVAADEAPKDPRLDEIDKLKQVAADCGAAIDVHHVEGFGVAVVISAKSADDIKAVQEAAAAYLEAVQPKSARPKPVKPAAVGRKKAAAVPAPGGPSGRSGVQESVKNTSAGVLIHVYSRDPKVIDELHEHECCKWCVCPARTTSCVKVCPHC